jgi:hypothetical protein
MHQEKWQIKKKKKKGYLKIHIAVVNIKTNKEILAFLEVTEMRRRMMEKLCPG